MKDILISGYLYCLDDNKILQKSYEMTNYHRNDYDYVVRNVFHFEDGVRAKILFEALNNAYMSGWAGGVKHANIKFEDKIRNLLKETINE